MWKDMEKQTKKSEESEKKEEKLRKPMQTKTKPENNDIKLKMKNEITKQQQQQANNKNINKQSEVNKTTRTTNSKTTQNKNKQAMPNSKLRVQGKQISDIETLRDFLAKKKLERAEKGKLSNNTIEASHTARSAEIKQRDKPTTTGEPALISEKQGLEIAAKGDTVKM